LISEIKDRLLPAESLPNVTSTCITVDWKLVSFKAMKYIVIVRV